MRLTNYDALWLLWALPILIAVYGYCFYQKKQTLRRFARSELLGRINDQVSVGRQVLKAGLLLLAVVSIIAALTGPGWNPRPEKIQRKGRDVVVLLDVSRSMLAEDITPNRLEQSKLAIGDLLAELQGDRIGIVTFAGSAAVKCPLTQDYGFARMVLNDIDTESVGRGGTNIGDAIRKTTNEVFDNQDRDFKDIILITDGEDHGSFPVQAAEKAAEQGIRIFVIGLGNEEEGTRIPIIGPNGEKTFVQYQGKDVWSKLDGKTLREIALATPGGGYLAVTSGTFRLEDVYQQKIVSSGQKQLESTTVWQYNEKFQLFLALALGLLVVEALVSERKNR